MKVWERWVSDPPLLFFGVVTAGRNGTKAHRLVDPEKRPMHESLIAEADRAAAQGDLKQAEQHLLKAVEQGADDPALFLRIASLQRARGQLQDSRRSVERALALSPRDFTALLLRASLLDRLGDPTAGEAWTHALAQRPDGDLPAHLSNVVGEAERRSAEWLRKREELLQARMADVEQRSGSEELNRIRRFRSNTLRQTRHYHSEPTHFHYPGLRELEIHPRSKFPWLEDIERATDVIISELRAVMASQRAELVPYVHYEDHVPMDQWRPLNNNVDWTAIHLIRNGHEVEANSLACPETMRLLQTLPQPKIAGASPNAMFSLLAPQTSIPPHVGINNARLVCHLPLVVPEGCWFRVGAETLQWEQGKAFVFDDTIEHEAVNPSDALRVVFIFDVWHPDLTVHEQEAVAELIGAEAAPASL
ncbi:MAG TPA: aspartyl/asparaginyl beta-hydroxylase domain-containing protein [Sphingomicrobium sp.]|nr:aspartyl/asparaginyl beta-hydroxylase domain-containing protein [Sphingomicrobium sp.]